MNNDITLEQNLPSEEPNLTEENERQLNDGSEEMTPEQDVASEEMMPEQDGDSEIQPEEQTEEQTDENASPESESASSDGDEPKMQNDGPLPYHERYYLKYREGKRSVSLDLKGTKSFLQGIGFDGGELRQARKGKDSSALLVDHDKNKNNQMFCSYCGTEISGIEFYRLPDGRMRCTACDGTVVKSKSEMEELCQRVISNMDSFFGATLDVPVSIDVLDELKIKRKLGIPIGSRDGESILVLGVAVNKKKNYKILLENGAPRISLIATFAHELTHIWQYTHWDANKKFNKNSKYNRLLIYEGMAKWAEIQYLYLIGETTVAKREEYITRKREDEYGIGFRLYESKYPLSRETMTCDDTPFTPNCYPIK